MSHWNILTEIILLEFLNRLKKLEINYKQELGV